MSASYIPLLALYFLDRAYFLRPETVIGMEGLADNKSWDGFFASFTKGAFFCQNFQEHQKLAPFNLELLPKFEWQSLAFSRE